MYTPTHNFLTEYIPCECCGPRYMTGTAGTVWQKWTKKDIQGEIISISKELVEAKWYERGDVKRRLRHWVNKLKKYEEADEEFKFTK